MNCLWVAIQKFLLPIKNKQTDKKGLSKKGKSANIQKSETLIYQGFDMQKERLLVGKIDF